MSKRINLGVGHAPTGSHQRVPGNLSAVALGNAAAPAHTITPVPPQWTLDAICATKPHSKWAREFRGDAPLDALRVFAEIEVA